MPSVRDQVEDLLVQASTLSEAAEGAVRGQVVGIRSHIGAAIALLPARQAAPVEEESAPAEEPLKGRSRRSSRPAPDSAPDGESGGEGE